MLRCQALDGSMGMSTLSVLLSADKVTKQISVHFTTRKNAIWGKTVEDMIVL